MLLNFMLSLLISVLNYLKQFKFLTLKIITERIKSYMTLQKTAAVVILDGGYLYKFHYPLKVDGPLAVQVAYNINLASAKAIKKFSSNTWPWEIFRMALQRTSQPIKA